jgi:hypothetical protein
MDALRAELKGKVHRYAPWSPAFVRTGSGLDMPPIRKPIRPRQKMDRFLQEMGDDPQHGGHERLSSAIKNEPQAGAGQRTGVRSCTHLSRYAPWLRDVLIEPHVPETEEGRSNNGMSMKDFFSRNRRKKEIPIRQYVGRSPMFFKKFQLMAGVYTADIAACKAFMPNSDFNILQIMPGRCLIGIHCMEYYATDVGPYNEVSISVGIAPRPTFFSAWGIVKSALTQNFHAHILQLPVTTEVAYFGGVDYFNYPKFVADISFEERDGSRICTLSEQGSGKMIMEFEGRKIGTKRSDLKTITLNSYPIMNGKMVHAKMCVNTLEMGERFFGSHGKVKIGSGDIADMLLKLNLGKEISYLYAPECQSVMYLPKPLEQ